MITMREHTLVGEDILAKALRKVTLSEGFEREVTPSFDLNFFDPENEKNFDDLLIYQDQMSEWLKGFAKVDFIELPFIWVMRIPNFEEDETNGNPLTHDSGYSFSPYTYEDQINLDKLKVSLGEEFTTPLKMIAATIGSQKMYHSMMGNYGQLEDQSADVLKDLALNGKTSFDFSLQTKDTNLISLVENIVTLDDHQEYVDTLNGYVPVPDYYLNSGVLKLRIRIPEDFEEDDIAQLLASKKKELKQTIQIQLKEYVEGLLGTFPLTPLEVREFDSTVVILSDGQKTDIREEIFKEFYEKLMFDVETYLLGIISVYPDSNLFYDVLMASMILDILSTLKDLHDKVLVLGYSNYNKLERFLNVEVNKTFSFLESRLELLLKTFHYQYTNVDVIKHMVMKEVSEDYESPSVIVQTFFTELKQYLVEANLPSSEEFSPQVAPDFPLDVLRTEENIKINDQQNQINSLFDFFYSSSGECIADLLKVDEQASSSVQIKQSKDLMPVLYRRENIPFKLGIIFDPFDAEEIARNDYELFKHVMEMKDDRGTDVGKGYVQANESGGTYMLPFTSLFLTQSTLGLENALDSLLRNPNRGGLKEDSTVCLTAQMLADLNTGIDGLKKTISKPSLIKNVAIQESPCKDNGCPSADFELGLPTPPAMAPAMGINGSLNLDICALLKSLGGCADLNELIPNFSVTFGLALNFSLAFLLNFNLNVSINPCCLDLVNEVVKKIDMPGSVGDMLNAFCG